MEMTFEEFIEAFKKYVEDYGYEPDEVRSLYSWVRDFLVYQETESKSEVEEIEK